MLKEKNRIGNNKHTRRPNKSKNKEELYAEQPYSDMYIHYIMAQIDKYNEEYDRYSNHMALFNEDYSEYENQYHRTHMPIQHGTFSV
ncbi:MAG: hypothetical protein ACLUR5_06635 [Eubacterium ventriosum]